MMKRFASCLLALFLCCACCMASGELLPAEPQEAEVTVQDGGFAVGAHSLRWPELTGFADAELEAAVNDTVLSRLGVMTLVTRFNAVMASENILTADWRGGLMGDVFSCVEYARGPVCDYRPTEVLACVNIDLRTGDEISFGDLFNDPDAAREAMEDYMCDVVAPELNSYLDIRELLPLPEQWFITAEGITFCYPIAQYGLLSGRAGMVRILWSELEELLITGEDSIPDRIGALRCLSLNDESAALISEAAAAGCIPGIPVQLGGSVREAVDTWKLLIDPELCDGGRLFSLEDDAFRGVYIITDAIAKGWDGSEVLGIRCDRIAFYGLRTNVTTREAYLAVLGEPQSVLTLNEAQADGWRLEPGISDYYIYGEHRLRLHCNEDGVLVTVFLLP